MKRVVTILLALAMPLVAEEPKSTDQPAQTAAPAAGTVEQKPVQQDSLLVQAAKRANRLGKKPTNVITNETVKQSKGHVTTAAVQREVVIPALYVPETQVAARKAALKAAEEKRVAAIKAENDRKKAETRKRIVATAAAAAEEGYYDELEDDAATLEAAADQAAGVTPADQKKPPQP